MALQSINGGVKCGYLLGDNIWLNLQLHYKFQRRTKFCIKMVGLDGANHCMCTSYNAWTTLAQTRASYIVNFERLHQMALVGRWLNLLTWNELSICVLHKQWVRESWTRKVTQPTHLEWTFHLCTAQAMSKGVLDPCTSEHRTQG